VIYQVLIEHLPSFSDVLANSSLPSHRNTFELDVTPLGEHRLKIVEMVDHLIKT
jgi:hypothetical protein